MKRKFGYLLWRSLVKPRMFFYRWGGQHPNRFQLWCWFTIDRLFDRLGDSFVWGDDPFFD